MKFEGFIGIPGSKNVINVIILVMTVTSLGGRSKIQPSKTVSEYQIKTNSDMKAMPSWSFHEFWKVLRTWTFFQYIENWLIRNRHHCRMSATWSQDVLWGDLQLLQQPMAPTDIPKVWPASQGTSPASQGAHFLFVNTSPVACTL